MWTVRQNRKVNEISALLSILSVLVTLMFLFAGVYCEYLGNLTKAYFSLYVGMVSFVIFIILVYFSGDFWEG